MNKRIIIEAADMIAFVFTQPTMKRYFESFGIDLTLIKKHYSTKKTFSEELMLELYNSGKDSDKKILHGIVEDLTCSPDIKRYNYVYSEDQEDYKIKLDKLRKLCISDGYNEKNGVLVRKPVLIEDVDKKYQFIITNLNDYSRDDLSTTFQDAIKNYSINNPSSLDSLRKIIENLIKHILKVNGERSVNVRENMKTLRKIGVLKIIDKKFEDTENDFSYNLYQMLSNWAVHYSRTPLLEHDYLFQTSILYLDFLIKRINQAGIKT